MKFVYRRQATDAEAIEVEIVPLAERESIYRVTVQGQCFELSARLLQRAAVLRNAEELLLQYEGREYRLYDASQRRRTTPTPTGDLRAPTAGKILRLLVQPGDRVAGGDVLIILEAMKMEQHILAPHAGVVERLLCAEGEQVNAGAELLVLRPDTPESSASDVA